MKRMLKGLFDYQRFEKNAKLEKLINETEARCGQQLQDDDLYFVNAAGEFGLQPGTITGNDFSPSGCGENDLEKK